MDSCVRTIPEAYQEGRSASHAFSRDEKRMLLQLVTKVLEVAVATHIPLTRFSTSSNRFLKGLIAAATRFELGNLQDFLIGQLQKVRTFHCH